MFLTAHSLRNLVVVARTLHPDTAAYIVLRFWEG